MSLLLIKRIKELKLIFIVTKPYFVPLYPERQKKKELLVSSDNNSFLSNELLIFITL
jgi:hypothetical protein